MIILQLIKSQSSWQVKNIKIFIFSFLCCGAQRSTSTYRQSLPTLLPWSALCECVCLCESVCLTVHVCLHGAATASSAPCVCVCVNLCSALLFVWWCTVCRIYHKMISQRFFYQLLLLLLPLKCCKSDQVKLSFCSGSLLLKSFSLSPSSVRQSEVAAAAESRWRSSLTAFNPTCTVLPFAKLPPLFSQSSQSLKYLFSSFTCSTKYSNYDVPLVRMTPKSAFHQSKLSPGSAAAEQHQHSRRSLVCIKPARQITHSFNWKLASQSKFEDLLSLSLTHMRQWKDKK